MTLSTLPWYNCLAWAFAQILGYDLPYREFRKFVLDWRKPIDVAFIEKAAEFGIVVKKVSSFEEMQQYTRGFLVYGYYMEEIPCGCYKDYRDSGFHVALYYDGEIFHQNGCGVMPTTITVKDLQNGGYENPLYFAVLKKEH